MIFDHSKVLVSSINGTPNSMDNNREVAVLVQSPDAARYYQGFFEFDWTRSPSIQLPPEENIAPCQNQLVQDAGSGPAGFFPMTAFTGPQQTSGGASAPLAPATTEL
jgi:phosphatidylserine/phosphatidylglycerophosphate/cardiolipin synthase-like enzyme